MSQIDSILGLPDLSIEQVKRSEHVEVWCRPKMRPACIYCEHHPVRIKSTHHRVLKHTRQGNQLMILHLALPKYHCPECNHYFRHPLRGIRPRLRATESYRLEVFEAHDGGVSQRKLTLTHNIGSATVERWYQHHIQRRVSELSGRDCPRILGIDEHFFSRKKGFATTFVDLKNHKVFDVVLGRSEASLRRYLSQLTGRDRVQFVVMDLSETYRKIVQQYFPQAKIVADRFHVIRLVNQHFLQVWNQQDPVGRKNRGLLSLMRRHHWNLSPEQQLNLRRYLEQFPILKALYQAKQKLNSLLLIKNVRAKHAKKFLPQLLQLLDQFEQSPAKVIAHTIRSWLEPIVRMWRFSKSNGITEGFHTKMEMISRRAFGFRNFQNYRLRVLALCGWSGVINRV
ncbi:ISL3 family transposase [Polynucleobacter rarus]|uniref:ISL3 family transposase n=1 Tax=Polynucleobacter rarus TaxID=556055 RepID=UPI000D3E5B28|nr:ISL3 family transposase [Polynucleobacter rarus]